MGKTLWKLRNRGNFVLQDSSSAVYIPETRSDLSHSREFQSLSTMNNTRQKHARSLLSPIHKFRPDAVSSHVIGWHQEAGHGELNRSKHGITDSVTTKTFNNMKA